ncbi:MAG: polymer-forming cytoskeletal protein [Nitrospira sp.]|nr:polymer-forming cytoskeletal protein [Nitrospira sp.]
MWKQGNTVYSDEGMIPEGQGSIRSHAVSSEAVSAFIGAGVTFKGVLTYSGTLRIDGSLEGEIRADGGLLVGSEGMITAKVSAGSLVCEGAIMGDIQATERVTLLAQAVIQGSLKTPVLSIEEGARLNGTLEMAAPVVVQQNPSRGPKLYPVGLAGQPLVKRVDA